MSDNKKIILLGVFSELIYLSFFLIDPIRNKFGDFSLVLSLSNFYFYITELLILLAVFYFIISRINFDEKKFKLAMIFFGIFSASVFFIRPVTSIDAYTYIHTSRVLSVHRANPYIYNFDNFPTDSFAPIIKNIWSNKPTPYAPLFTIISSLITLVGQNSLTLSLYLFKLLFITLNLTCAFLIYKIFNNYKAAVLYAWNPLLLFEFGINAHNDILTLFFLLLSLFFIYNRKLNFKNYSLSLFFLLLSVMIKYISAIFLPILFLIALRNLSTMKQRLQLFGISALISFLVLASLYLPFWTGFDIFSRVISQSTNSFSVWIFSSPLIIIIAAILNIFKFNNLISVSTFLGKITFVITYIFILLKIIFSKSIGSEKNIYYFSLALLAFFFSFFSWLMPWYLTCLLVLFITQYSVKKNEYFFFAIHATTLYGILYYIILR